jgi:alkylation response protein AidB-like acyl-CoA dehydrogenase
MIAPTAAAAPPVPAAPPAPAPGPVVPGHADTSPEALARLTATLAATAERYDRSAEFPWEPIHAVHAAGVLSLGIGPAWGGQELPVTETARVFQALGKGDPSVALLTAMTVMQHASEARLPRWPAALYEQLVRDSAERPMLLNAIRAEPELGAPARGGLPATTVARTADGWVLNGHKGYGTGSEGLAYHLVWAATQDDDPLVGHVIVPGDSPGIEIIKTWDHFGLRASSTHDVIYTDIEVPFENFQGVPASAPPGDPALFAASGLGVMALYVGVARAAQEFFITFANERAPTALGAPIATTERIQTIAGEIEAQLTGAEQILYSLAAGVDAGDRQALQRTSVAKLLVTRAAVTAVQTAVTALGNPGLTRHHPLERHLRDVQCSRVHPPQDDAALIGAGRRTLAAGARPATA